MSVADSRRAGASGSDCEALGERRVAGSAPDDVIVVANGRHDVRAPCLRPEPVGETEDKCGWSGSNLRINAAGHHWMRPAAQAIGATALGVWPSIAGD